MLKSFHSVLGHAHIKLSREFDGRPRNRFSSHLPSQIAFIIQWPLGHHKVIEISHVYLSRYKPIYYLRNWRLKKIFSMNEISQFSMSALRILYKLHSKLFNLICFARIICLVQVVNNNMYTHKVTKNWYWRTRTFIMTLNITEFRIVHFHEVLTST